MSHRRRRKIERGRFQCIFSVESRPGINIFVERHDDGGDENTKPVWFFFAFFLSLLRVGDFFDRFLKFLRPGKLNDGGRAR